MAGIYRVFGGISIALLTMFLHGAAPARADDPLYTVEGVTVDITAESAIAAREQAFAKAEQDAFTVLAERLLPEDTLAGFAPPESDVISDMVQDFEITDERLSHVRYKATYTFRFRDADVQSFFKVHGKSYAAVASRPVLVLPFYQWGTRTVLWEGDNPWLTAWTRTKTVRGLVPVRVPIGDAQDVIDIADDQALTYDPAALQSMLLRYDTGDALIAIATPQWPDNAQNVAAGTVPATLSVMTYRTGPRGPEFITTLKIAAVAEDTPDTLYDRAADEVKKSLQSDWKAKTVVAPAAQETASSLQARVRIASMGEWVQMQSALNRVQGVENIRVIKLSPQEAQIQLSFSGSEDRLRLALQQANIVLSQPQVSFASYNGAGAGAGGSPLVYDLYLNNPGRMNP